MLFNSWQFLFIFLPITFSLFWLFKGRTSRYIILCIASYIFYSFWDYRFCALMMISTLISYFTGLGLLTFTEVRSRRLLVFISVTVDLLILGFFKYFNFFLDNLSILGEYVKIPFHVPYLNIILPVGLSFYTFHTISYVVDSYRGKITPTRNFLEFCCYVSLFSQLVCGPIIRFWQIEQDLTEIDKPRYQEDMHLGWSFFTIGMIEKVILADTLAIVLNPAFQNYEHLSTLQAWVEIFAFMYQYLFDFSGYSDMSVVGYLFGLRIPQNFNSPYKSKTIADFFRRWHISLYMCLRDFVYFPLGGSKHGALLTVRNVLITTALCGLWHGANWTYVLCFVYAGTVLILQETFKQQWNWIPQRIQPFVNFWLLSLAWTFFRSKDMHMASSLFHTMFHYKAEGAPITGAPVLGLMLIPCFWLAHFAPNSFDIDHKWKPSAVIGLTLLYCLCLFLVLGGNPSPFLYFQF